MKKTVATAAVVSAMVGGVSAALVLMLAMELRRDPAPAGFAGDAPSSGASGTGALESGLEALQIETRELRRRLEGLENRSSVHRRSGGVPRTGSLAEELATTLPHFVGGMPHTR